MWWRAGVGREPEPGDQPAGAARFVLACERVIFGHRAAVLARLGADLPVAFERSADILRRNWDDLVATAAE